MLLITTFYVNVIYTLEFVFTPYQQDTAILLTDFYARGIHFCTLFPVD